jgi:5'-3' exoribonuclease 2
MFAGNDFIPELPSVSIHGGAIGHLIDLYKEQRPMWSNYLCTNGRINTPVL